MAGHSLRSEQHQVIDHDGMARIQKFGDQDATLVASAAGDEDSFHKRVE